MKIKKDQKKTKKIIVISAALILIVSLLLGAFVFALNQPESAKKNNTSDSVNLEPPTSEQRDEGERIKEESLDHENDINNDTKITAYVTSSNVGQDSYSIRIFIDKLSNIGSCAINLTSSSSQSVTVEPVGIQALPNGSTCKGFDVPLSLLGSSPNWLATIVITVEGVEVTVREEISL